jgi:surface polysaccharide O-acyltransferase-like enzyme
MCALSSLSRPARKPGCAHILGNVTATETPAFPVRNQAFDLLRIISICGVVAIHTFGPTAANPAIQGSATAWGARVLSAGFVWAVPVFVMLSGALNLTERAHRDGPAAFYAKRFKRIVPALIAWNVIYLVLIRMVLLHEHISGWQIVTQLVNTTVYPQLYFLWLIAGLYAVAPVLAAFLAAGGTRRAVVFAAVVVAVTQLFFIIPGVLALGNVSQPVRWQALTFWIPYVGYFLAGYALSRLAVTRPWAIAAAAGVLALGAATILESGYLSRLRVLSAFSPADYQGTIVAILSICVFVAASYFLVRVRLGPRLARVVVTLSDASFGVFLVHLVILLIPYFLLEGFHTHASLAQAALAYIFIVVVSFAVSIVARRVPGLRAIF